MNVDIRQRSPATTQPAAAAARWLQAFEAALRAGDWAAAAALFAADGHWRDILSFTWTIGTATGPAAIEVSLRASAAGAEARNFRLPAERTPPREVRRAGTDCIEALFAFDTAHGPASGVLRLVDDGKRAWILATALDALKGFEAAGTRPAKEADYHSRDFGAPNWLDQRNAARAYADHDPTVLVIGGGQAGLSIAARLGALGLDTLIIDRYARVGDNWRKRYHALTLHNEVHVNHLPYMPFPPTWPVFIPKDKLANWFEAYVEALELNLWTGTELSGGIYDEAAGHWRVTLKRADGSTREMRPRHLVFATGVSGIPVRPQLPGLDAFAGTVLHSGAYGDGEPWRGKRAVVIGTGNSAHDVAQDLHASGATVTMVQRSPTYVVSLKEAQKVYSIYGEGMPIDDCDLLATAMPYPVLKHAYQLSTAEMRQVDAKLIAGLEARGFRIGDGEDRTGFQMMYLRRGGGYYFNVGCSDLIIDGKVGLLQWGDAEGFVEAGLKMKDGSVLPADLVVLATGYRNQQDVVRACLGDAVADRIGPVWGFDEGGELRNMWRQTAQRGLWFTAGSLAQCRIFSRYLALQIKAREEGMVPA